MRTGYPLDGANRLLLLTLLLLAGAMIPANMAARYADYIYAMKSGQLVHSGTPKEVIKTTCLQDVFGTQIQVIESEFGPIAVYA